MFAFCCLLCVVRAFVIQSLRAFLLALFVLFRGSAVLFCFGVSGWCGVFVCIVVFLFT